MTTQTTKSYSPDLDYWRKMYHPTENGVHLCGITYERDKSGEFQTVANFPSNNPRELFALLKEFEVSREEGDLVADLCIDSSTEEDFWVRRQSVDLMKRKIEHAGI